MAKFEYTKEHIKSQKLALLLGAITAGVADIFVVVLLMIAGLWGYVALPIILAVADLAFLALALFTNFRFRYSIAYTATYLAVFLGCVLGHFFVIRGGAETAMTAIALIIWVAVHILNFLVIILGAKGAVTKQKGHHLVTALLVILFIGAVGVYIGFGSSEGYFGQGSLTARPIVYVYDEKTDSYTATGVLDGSGKFAVIPEKFDGKPVRAIDATIFSANRLDRLEIETDASVSLLNLDKVSNITVQDITAGRETLTTLQREFYTAYRDGDKNAELLTLASRTAPSDLADDEIYITFSYTDTALDCIGETFLPSWIGHKGDRFELSSLADGIDYIINTDSSDEELLHKLYNSQKQGSGYILLPIMLDSKTPLNGASVQKSHQNIVVDFEKIYRVEIQEDNDTLYTMPESFTSILVEGQDIGYRYVTPSTIASLLPSVEKREGFTIAWDYGYGNGFTLPEATTSVEALLSTLDGRDENKFTVKPTWTMKAPTINSLTTNSTSGAFTYGDRVDFDINATAPANGTTLTYDWYFDDTYLATTENYEIPVILMNQNGVYTVKVTASSTSVTSLTSEITKSTTLTVAKKEIDITWNGIEDLSYVREYDSFSHDIGISYNENDLVVPTGAPRDIFTFEFSQSALKGAGKYDITVTLTGDADTKYVLRQNDVKQSYEITKKPVSVEWANLTLTYNAEAQKPTVAITAGVCDGDVVGINVTQASEKTVVGTYDATAVLDNDNYKIAESDIKQFTILRKDITITWSAEDSFVYNKTEQGPKPSTNGIEAKDISAGIQLTRINAGTNAGTYTVDVTINSDNYRIVTEGSTKEYTITPKPLNVDWKTSSLVYTAKKQHPDNSLLGICEGDSVDLAYEIEGGLGAVNVGTYTVIATSQNKNYVLNSANNTHTYDIIKASVYVAWANNTQTYAHEYLLPSYNIVGLLGSDTWGESVGHSIVVSVSGGQLNVCDNAPITMTYTSDNYEIQALSLTSTLTITKKEVTLTWGNKSFTYNANAQIPTVSIASGAITNDSVTVSASGAQTIPGSGFEAVATLSNDNYVIVAGQEKCFFSIQKQTLTPVWSDNLVFDYDSTEKNPTVSLEGIMDADTAKVEFTLSAPKVNAGTHTAKITLSTMTDCYVLSSTEKSFTIKPAVLTPNWSDLSFIYDKTSHQPTVTFTGIFGNDVVNYEFNIAKQTNAGSYDFTIKLKNSNYTLTSAQTNTMTIEKATISVSFTGDSFSYNGKEQFPSYSFYGLMDGDTALESKSGMGTNVGQYTIRLTIGNPNYKIDDENSLLYDYEITKKSITINWGNNTFTFDNTPKFPAYSLIGLAQGHSESTLVPTKETQVNAGDYTVSYTIANGNYVIENPEHPLVINKLQVTPTWTKLTFVYNAEIQKPGFTLKQVANYTYKVESNIEGARDAQEGIYFEIYTNDPNVEIVNGSTSFTITPLEISVSWNTAPLTYTGTAQHPSANASGIRPADKETVFLTVTGGQVDAGENYTAYATINSANYTIKTGTESKVFSIRKKTISVSWQDYATVTFDGSEHKPVAKLPADAICGNDDVNIVYIDLPQVDAGTYTMHIELDNPNYEINSTYASRAYTIKPKSVRVTWGETVFTYDGQVQVPTATATGIFGEELISTVTGGERDARPNNPYTATAVCLDKNYQLENPTIKFTINPRELVVEWSNPDYTYTGNVQKLTASATPLDGDSAPLQITYKTKAGQSVTNPTNAGTYVATASTSNTNYAVSSHQKEYTIKKATITITWNGTSATYDGTAKSPTAVAQGVNGKALAFTYTFKYSGQTVSSAKQKGVYTVTVTLTNSADQNNYELQNPTISNFVIA